MINFSDEQESRAPTQAKPHQRGKLEKRRVHSEKCCFSGSVGIKENCVILLLRLLQEHNPSEFIACIKLALEGVMNK